MYLRSNNIIMGWFFLELGVLNRAINNAEFYERSEFLFYKFCGKSNFILMNFSQKSSLLIVHPSEIRGLCLMK